MSSPSMLDYQRQLIAASLDDFTPNAALANFCGGQFGRESTKWKTAVVDFLCKNIFCGLIEATHRPDISANRDVKALKNLLLLGDAQNGMDAGILWDVLYFNGTEKLVEILDKCGLRGWDALDSEESKELAALLTIIYRVSG